MTTYSDPFTRANGVLGAVPGGPVWEVLSGAWSVSANRALSTTTPGSNPLAVVETGTDNVDVSGYARHSQGNALYARVKDANNWVRLRSEYYSYSSQYYVTEYEYLNYEYYETWQPRIMRREVQYKVFPAWTDVAWVDTGVTWACRSSAPAAKGDDYNACGVPIHRYRNIVYGTACSPTSNSKYKEQMRDLNPTFAYKNVTDGAYSLACDESYTSQTFYQDTDASGSSAQYSGWRGRGVPYTGPTRYDYLYSYSGMWNSSGPWAPGESATYWSSTPPDGNNQMPGTDPPDRWQNPVTGGAGNTRQAGPYTSTSYDRRVVLEKCVDGVVTALGSYTHGQSAPTLRLVASGNTVQAYVNGTLRISVTDSSNRYATKVGIGGGASEASPTAPDWDDFSVTFTADSVRVGGTWVSRKRKVKVGGTWRDYMTLRK